MRTRGGRKNEHEDEKEPEKDEKVKRRGVDEHKKNGTMTRKCKLNQKPPMAIKEGLA